MMIKNLLILLMVVVLCEAKEIPASLEFTCDTEDITTLLHNEKKKIFERDAVFFTPQAVVSNSEIYINLFSTQLLDENGEYINHKEIVNEGRWDILRNTGEIYFTPVEDFNGTSSIQYVINNNCDYAVGISNVATLTVEINASSRSLPTIDGVCLFAEMGEANDDIIVMNKKEKIKVIDVFSNDDNGLENSTKFVDASLRLVSPDQNITRSVNIKGKGTWAVNTNTGQVLFMPENGFTGAVQIQYTMDSPCSYDNNAILNEANIRLYSAQINLSILPSISTPTPTPIPPATSTPTPVLVPPVDGDLSETNEVNITSVKSNDAGIFDGYFSFFILSIFLLIGLKQIRDEQWI